MSRDDKQVERTLQKLKARFGETTADAGPPGESHRSGQARRGEVRGGAEPTDEERVAPALRNRRHWVVVSYDIVNDRRRAKVMKTLEGFGHRVQYSVFECELRPADLEKLKVRLKTLIQIEEDDVRFYDLCENCQGKVTMLGKARAYRQQSSVVV
jgi:CRISPR-associated protein Cas2